MFLFVLIVIICWNDDTMTIGATAINKSIDVGKDYLCVQYTCQSDKVCRGCFWMSKCWEEQICIRKWCGDSPFLKDIQVVSNCQDFSGNSQNATEKTEFHRCCIIDERASLIQWENVTWKRNFEQKPEDTDKCQILEYGPALKIEFCQSDKQDSSISTGTSLYHSYLSIVIVIPIIIIFLL